MDMPQHHDKPRTYANFIGGDDHEAGRGGTFTSTNPTTGQLWGHFALADADDVDTAVRAARRAFVDVWSQLSPTNGEC